MKPNPTSNDRREPDLRPVSWRAAGLAALSCLFTAAAFPAETRGLLRRIEAGGNSVPDLVSNVALYVEAAGTPDPLVPAGPFRARWSGSVSVELRGDYQFRADALGTFDLSINGAPVLHHENSPASNVWSAPVRLRKGTNALVATLVRSGDGPAQARLWWQARGLAPQPVPTAALSPDTDFDPTAFEPTAAIRRGRDLFLRFRCGRCHAVEVPQPAPELAMDAPSLDDIGGRLRRSWIVGWLLRPASLQPTTTMPRVLHGPEAAADAEAIAAWLGSLGKESPEPGPSGNAAVGRSLFEALHCAGCHTAPDQAPDPARVSLANVGGKFTAGTLAAFLRQPAGRFAWTGMPDFRLSAEEGAHLAAWLQSGPGPAATNAAPANRAPGPSVDPALLARGKELVETRGCRQCHAAPAENRLSAPRLAELPAAAWSRGCVADTAPTTGPTPWFDLTPTERAALRAFAATDRGSLGRSSSADFADRWTRHLRCDACHGAVENVPSVARAGEKLRPEWSRRLFAGQVSYKPRPWLQARMPAFPAFAEHLAAGLSAGCGLPPKSPGENPIDKEAAGNGRRLVSASGGFACVTCHAIGAFQATAVFEAPGVNFAFVAERLLPEYFQRWVRHPQSIDPATKMPLYFDEDGASALTDFYEGDGPKTIDALWNYLRQGPDLAPPPP